MKVAYLTILILTVRLDWAKAEGWNFFGPSKVSNNTGDSPDSSNSGGNKNNWDSSNSNSKSNKQTSGRNWFAPAPPPGQQKKADGSSDSSTESGNNKNSNNANNNNWFAPANKNSEADSSGKSKNNWFSNTNPPAQNKPTPGALVAVELNKKFTLLDLLSGPRTTIFVKLLQQTDLGKLLSGNESYTIFAPTDDALNRIPRWANKKLMSSSAKLGQMLLYHISPGRTLVVDFKNDVPIKTLLTGGFLTSRVYIDHVPSINHANIIGQDNLATNGIVHVLGDALFPVPTETIFNVLENCPSLHMFMNYVKKAGLEDDLKNSGRAITLFAPTNDALEKVPARLKEILDNKDSSSERRELILHHILIGAHFSPEFRDGQEWVTAAGGQEVTVEVRNDRLKEVGSARVLHSDIVATNGVVFAIDRFLVYDELC